jgi:hypothetical protein
VGYVWIVSLKYIKRSFLVLTCLALGVCIAHSESLYVSSASTNPASPYGSRETAATGIAQAVSLAVDGDVVRVADGLYGIREEIRLVSDVDLVSEHGATGTVIAADGGGRCLFMDNTGAVVRGFTLTGGRADFGGGAVCLNGLLAECIVISNRAHGVGGGGVYATGGRIEQCTIRQNSARGIGGGGLYVPWGAVVSRCRITANTAPGGYGGGAAISGDGRLENSLVAENAGVVGGGLFWSGSYTGAGWITHCTVTRNTGYVGAIYCEGEARARNTILYDNTDTGGQTTEVQSITSLATFQYCCVPSSVSGTGNVHQAPGFVNALQGDFHLLSDSPCIDAGGAEGALTNDFDGTARPLDGDTNGPAVVDIGAYEYVP